MIELESVKMRISALAHQSATGIGCVSGLFIFESEATHVLKMVWLKDIITQEV